MPGNNGAIRVPTKLLELRGAYKHQAGRREDRANEPVVTAPVGDPPEDFTGAVLQAWNDINNWAPAGVLTIADRAAVESAARLLAGERDGTNTCPMGCRLDKLLGKFGMTPSDRSKVSVSIPAPKPNNPFANIKNIQ